MLGNVVLNAIIKSGDHVRRATSYPTPSTAMTITVDTRPHKFASRPGS